MLQYGNHNRECLVISVKGRPALQNGAKARPTAGVRADAGKPARTFCDILIEFKAQISSVANHLCAVLQLVKWSMSSKSKVFTV